MVRFVVEVNHIRSHEGIPDHTASKHAHHHDHDHHQASNHHVDNETENVEQSPMVQSGSHNGKIPSKASSAAKGLNASDTDAIHLIVAYHSKKINYQEVLWSYLYTQSLVDPPEKS